jgi:hypothetical protein
MITTNQSCLFTFLYFLLALTTASDDDSPDLMQGVALLRQIFPKESTEELKQLHRSHISSQQECNSHPPPPMLPTSIQIAKDDTVMSIPVHDKNAEDNKIAFLPGITISESPPRSHRPPRLFKQSFDPDESGRALRKSNRSKRIELKKDEMLRRIRFDAEDGEVPGEGVAPQEYHQPGMSSLENINPAPLLTSTPLQNFNPPAFQPLPATPPSSTSCDDDGSISNMYDEDSEED